MPLVEPKIDQRSYQEILNEAIARIPVHNPEWTNFNASDPGITLVQLFAFMTENLIYRSNLLPKRNKMKFLKLLGIPMKAAQPASGIATFGNTRGPLQTTTLSSGLEVYAGQVPFQTLDGLHVLPVEARIYYKSRLPQERRKKMEALYEQLYWSFKDSGINLEMYETKPLEYPASGVVFPVVDLAGTGVEEDAAGYTIDGSLWLALLARGSNTVEETRKAIANKVLTIGILPELRDAGRVLSPEGRIPGGAEANLIYELPMRDPTLGFRLPDKPELRVAKYNRLESRPSGDLLSESGVVELTLPGSEDLRLWENLEPLEQGVGDFPPSLEDTNIENRVITWIRIRLPLIDDTAKKQFRARISWVGINAARVTQQAHVFSEILGKGTGEPDQAVTLVHKPVIPESVELTVNGETWYEIDDIMAADSEVPARGPRLQYDYSPQKEGKVRINVYTVDRESGEIRFGDGLRGARPPFGAIIRASYDYGGGNAGNVGIGAVNKCPSLPAGLSITNPLPTWGGDESETVEEAEKRIPGYLKHRDRLVSMNDFKEITTRTPGVELGRIEVLPLIHPDIPDDTSLGVVTVLVIPRNDPIQPDAPLPDRLFLDTVCRYLNPRRLITTEVHVVGPEYVPVWVSVGIEVIPGRDLAPVIEAVKEELRGFLSPLSGSFEGKGWPLKKDIEALELLTIATRIPGVSKINKVLLSDKTGTQTERVGLKGLELPRLTDLAVQVGEPLGLTELRDYPAGGAALGGIPKGAVTRVVPVPVIPSEFRC